MEFSRGESKIHKDENSVWVTMTQGDLLAYLQLFCTDDCRSITTAWLERVNAAGNRATATTRPYV